MNNVAPLCDSRRVLEKIKVAFNTLNRISPGLTNRIDLYFYLRYGKSFIDILMENPRTGISDLNELYGGNSESVKYFFYMILRFVLKGNIHMVNNALRLLQEERYEELINMLCSINGAAS